MIMTREIRSALIVLAALTVAGCQAQPARPNFLARSLQDCQDGDQAACAMLGSLSASVPATQPSGARVEPRPRTQQEQDVDAIMNGIRRARSSPPSQDLKIAPNTGDDS